MTDNLCLCGAEKHACVVRHLAVTLSHRCVSGSGLNECKECYSVCRLKCSSFVVFFVAGKCVYFSFVGLNVFFLFLFLLRRKTEQFLHMQSKGSSYGPSARDGGLLDSMKTLKSPNWSLQFSEDPTSPSPPHPNLPNLTPFPSTQSYATPIAKKKNTSLSDSDTELNKTIMITRSTLTCPCPLRPENVSSASVFFVSFLLNVSFTAIGGTALKNSSNCDVRTNFFPAPPKHPRHLSLSYSKLFVTCSFCIVH